jgi:hypothetical protein
MNRIALALGSLFLLSNAHAASPVATSALEFLREQQSNGRDGFDVGQWPSYVTSTLPSVIGVGRDGEPYKEATLFGATSVANILSEIHFTDPSYTAIPPMVEKALDGFAPYRWGSVFHFYPPASYRGVAVRAPRFMYLAPRWHGFTNTPPDADDTATAYLLRAYGQAIRENKAALAGGFKMPAAAAKELSAYRDLDRNSHLYNGVHGDQDTGAFLTWLWDEKDPKMPHDYFATPDKGTRIPFNKNDVDCVVNTNVLKALTAGGQSRAPGYEEACRYLNDVVAKRELYTCGMYYPNEYALPYTMGAALELGVRCLEPSRAALVEIVLDKQLPDGSWKNHWKNPHVDYVQSTAWALNALLALGNPRDAAQRESVRRGLEFLKSQAKRDGHGHVYWEGEVFYAAIFIARMPVVWRSTSYTTASAAQAFVTADARWGIR